MRSQSTQNKGKRRFETHRYSRSYIENQKSSIAFSHSNFDFAIDQFVNYSGYMRIFRKILFFLMIIAPVAGLSGQIIETDPALPVMGESVIIYFNSDQETGTLKNFEGDLYAHTGVTIEGVGNWQNVIGSWGNNTTQPKLTYLGSYRYKLEITPDIETFYPNMDGTEKVTQLCFVFRNAAADKQTADLFVEVFEEALNVTFLTPDEPTLIVSINDQIEINITSLFADSLELFVNDVSVNKVIGVDDMTHTLIADIYGGSWVLAKAYNMPDFVADSFYFYVKQDPVIEAVPAGIEDGVNYTGTGSVTLVLTAPGKTDAFLLGDFNNWQIGDNGYMKKAPDGERFWIEIDELTPDEEYAFQYLVDGSIRIADPYSEKVLDSWNDPYIDEETYPGLKEYPMGVPAGYVGVLQTEPVSYQWHNTEFVPPAIEDLVIYELLIRDFIGKHNYPTLTDTLDYLNNLGVNAIELMPVNEFDGNLSWGYNPAFYFAPDKYYGTANMFREFIDSCHSRGIAVILDIVLNHSTGSSSLAALYWDKETNNVSADNPWFNVVPTHDYNVFHDFNHESDYTRAFSKRVMEYWIEEYNVDGYRFDLSKGFTQKNTLGNVEAWGAYDASRVALWKMYANHIWSFNPGHYVILEHFADNTEEKELAEYGMMLWGNLNYEYTEASMGYSSDIDWGSYIERGWAVPHVITYMESHDEERMQFKNTTYGASSGDYNIRDLYIGLERDILAAVFFFTIPGPKMIWQFEELGYDYSINYNGRTGEKPIKWNYLETNQRRRVYESFAALIDLKMNQPAFRSNDFIITQEGKKKRININHESMDVVVLGNFDVVSGQISAEYSQTGWWYEFFTGDSVEISNTGDLLTLQSGEYRLYTTKKLAKPDIIVSINDLLYGEANSWFKIYPNPVTDFATISFDENVSFTGPKLKIEIFTLSGQIVKSIYVSPITGKTVDLTCLNEGIYFLRATRNNMVGTQRFVKVK